MNEGFIVTPKSEFQDEKSVVMTIRIDRELQAKYDELALKSGRSRNELIGMALEYAIDNVRFVDNSKSEG